MSLITITNGIAWKVSGEIARCRDIDQVLQKLKAFFDDQDRRPELFTPSADERGINIFSPLLPSDHRILFVSPIPDQWSRIDCYEEEGGGGGESNRKHHRGEIYYRRNTIEVTA